jgi:hypothetical protein
VFHALDYASALGFEPHRDFKSALFGPRPEALENTPWSAPAKPIYVSGPHDNERVILQRLTMAVGADGFEERDAFAFSGDFEQDDVEDDDVQLVYSPLAQTVARGDQSLYIAIYRGRDERTWLLEVEDSSGGSTVWDERFETDRAALDAALQAVEDEGIESFTCSHVSPSP